MILHEIWCIIKIIENKYITIHTKGKKYMKKTKKLLTICLMFVCMLMLFPALNAEAASKVKMNKTKTTVYIGTTTTLKVTGTKKTVTWSSDNKKVAVVNQKGKVTPKKAGKATITAKVAGKKYTCKVTVKKPYINTPKKTLQVGKTYTLKLTGTKIKSVKTSDKKIATITKKGKVTAKNTGTATITLTGKDNKKYSCTITVKCNHNWNNGQLTEEVTCTTNGVKIYTCKICEATKTKTIKATGHNWECVRFEEATCTKDGFQEYLCNKCFNAEKKVIIEFTESATGHACSWVTTKEATCTETGLEEYTCNDCGKVTKTKTIAKTQEHNWKFKDVVSATCTEGGYWIWQCIDCNCTKEDNYIPAEEHYITYIDEYTPGNCTQEGYYLKRCYKCNEVVEKVILPVDKSVHEKKIDGVTYGVTDIDYGYQNMVLCKEVIKKATCSETGLRQCFCPFCNEEVERYTDIMPINKGNHGYQYEVTKEPSAAPAACEEDFGTRIVTCEYCDYENEETIVRIDIGNNESTLIYGIYYDDIALECVECINDYRVNTLGIHALTINEDAMIGAKIRAAEIAYIFSHKRPNSQRTWGEYFRSENIAAGALTGKKAFNDWFHSEGHYSNLASSSYTSTGIAAFAAFYTNEPLTPYYEMEWVNGFRR